MPNSQSREPGFESPLLPFRRLGMFVLFIDAPVDSAVNEYLAIDSGGNVSDLVVARNCCMAIECFQEMPSWCRNEQVCQGGQPTYTGYCAI